MKWWIITWVTMILVMGVSCLTAEACTLWAANGNVVGDGGSLIIKNRDWVPDHQQIIRLINPQDGYKYIGLYAINGKFPGLKAGINEEGLVVVSATASSIPVKERINMPHTRGLIVQLLKDCGSVDEVLSKPELFLGPQIVMVADKKKVATIEIGPEGKFSIETKDNGTVYHTNHFVLQSMLEFNRNIRGSSQKRYERIAKLLDNTPGNYDLDTFVTYSNDQHDGPDNSIFRKGSTAQKIRTMAVWAVALPQDGSAELYVRILNPGEAEQVFRVNTDDVFKGGLL